MKGHITTVDAFDEITPTSQLARALLTKAKSAIDHARAQLARRLCTASALSA